MRIHYLSSSDHKRLKTYVLLSLLLIIIIIFPISLLSHGSSSNVPKVFSQQLTGLYWSTLAYTPEHTAYIPISTGVGTISSGAVSWSYMFSSSEGWYSFNTNHLIVDLNGDGVGEVVTVDSSGRLVILNGADGSRLSYSAIDAGAFSTPVAGDIDNDGVPEIIVGTKDGCVEAIDIDPSTWSISVLWKSEKLDVYVSTSPLLYDLNSDGVAEVVVTTKFGLVALRSDTGSVIWRSGSGGLVLVGSPALIEDVNNDGVKDIVYCDIYGYVYGVSGKDGSELWRTDLWTNPTTEHNLILHTPVVADVDGDSVNEVILTIGREVFDWIPGTSSSVTSTGLKVAKRGVEGYLVIIDSRNGNIESIISPPTNRAFFTWFSQPAISVGDVDGDGLPEIFLGSVDGWIYRIDYSSGSYVVTSLAQVDTYWPSQVDTDANPTAISLAVCDIDNDGSYEVVAISTDADAFGNPRLVIYSIDASSGAVKWSIALDYTDLGLSRLRYSKFNWPSISLGDVDGDNYLEIIVSVYQAIFCID